MSQVKNRRGNKNNEATKDAPDVATNLYVNLYTSSSVINFFSGVTAQCRLFQIKNGLPDT